MGTQEMAVEGMLREYDYVSSAILMYRRMQMQAIGLGLVLYSSGFGLIGALADKPYGKEITSYLAVIAPWPIFFLVFCFYVMELRIKRAGFYIHFSLSKKLKQLADNFDVLSWEQSPSIHLSPIEKYLTNSSPFVLLISIPSIFTSTWLSFSEVTIPLIMLILNWFGLFLLIIMVVATIRVSHEYEKR